MSRLRLNTNLAALSAGRQLARSSRDLEQAQLRLASGLRINRASDDAAGLAIASDLRTDSRIYTQGVRNINDGLGLMNIAEGALRNLSDISLRIRELATQSANGVYAWSQRTNLDSEADQLVNEFNRIIATTSFNGQNLLDRTLTSLGIQTGYGINGALSLSLNQGLSRAIGTGNFTPTAYGGATTDARLADIDGDGDLDSISSSGIGPDLTILFNDGAGNFSTTGTITGVAASNSLAIGDLNGDGRLDVVSQRAAGTTVDVFLQNSNGTFASANAVTSLTGIGAANSISIGDADGDGDNDIIAGGSTGITMLKNTSNGTSFSASTVLGSGLVNRDTQFVDLGDDGILDIITTNGTLLVTMRGDGRGNFTTQQSITIGANLRATTVGDFNGDGLIDVANGHSSTTGVNIFLGNADGTLTQSGTLSTITNTGGITAADFNGDGHTDLIDNATTSGTAVLFLGNGDGTFQTGTNFSTGSASGSFVVRSGDLNGDGVIDATFHGAAATTTRVALQSTTSTTTLQALNLRNRSQARQTMDIMVALQDRINKELGQLGASQSRLQIAASNLTQSRDSYLEAASRIMDADVAEEAANSARERIRQQLGAFILAQANQQPQLALSLLRRK